MSANRLSTTSILVAFVVIASFLAALLPQTISPQPVQAETQEIFTTTPAGGIWTVPAGVTSVQVLVVAGGGGGGSGSTSGYAGGGGGAGGLIYNASYSVTSGANITVTVGTYGAGATTSQDHGANGSNSVFGTLTATKGGGGGSGLGSAGYAGYSGGSGGGGGVNTLGSIGNGSSGITGQGYRGGYGKNNAGTYSAGGGGGNGSVGGNGSAGGVGGTGGTGGNYSAVFGTGVGASGWFAGGGGGGAGAIGTGGTATAGGGNGGARSIGINGIANTGGGGGGGSNAAGGNGGTGVIVLRYIASPTVYLNISAGSGGTITTPGVGTYPYTLGYIANINANPDSCASFNNWTGDTGTVANLIDKATTITMNNNYSIQANFAANATVLSVTANNSGGSPYFDGSNPFSCSVNATIHANTSSGYVFAGWSPTDGIANSSAANTNVAMTQSRSLTAYYYLGAGSTPIPTVTPTPPGTGNGTTYLTWHMMPTDLIMTETPNYILVNMTAGINTSMNKYISKQLTLYIMQRPELWGLGRGGIWGEDAIIGLGSLTVSGKLNLFNGDLNVDGPISVTAAGNRVSGTLTCESLNTSGDGTDFQYGAIVTPCPDLTLPDIGETQSYFKTNLSTGTQDWNQADIDHEYVFNSSVELTNPAQNHGVYNSTTRRLKDGYYYCAETMTLSGSAIRGKVTFIAEKIIIDNTATGTNGNESAYIGLESYDARDLLLWSTGSSGNDIYIKGSDAQYHPCAVLKGILLAPSGEIKLEGTGSSPELWFIHTASSKAIIRNGGIMAETLSITGHDWWIYRW
jgi:hypothetical protein